MVNFSVGCHVSAAGGVWNAPKNAAALECEVFQIFTRPPMGGPAPKIDKESVEKFKTEMQHYGYGYSNGYFPFVVHCPYVINFGSAKKTTFHGSISIVSEELKRANSLSARFVMTHLGSFKDLGQEKGMTQAKKGLQEVLEKYESSINNSHPTQFLLEIAAGQGEIIGDTFEELAELMADLTKFKTFGGICFDTQHAWSSGYDITKTLWLKEFKKHIGLKWLRMSHINDSKIELGGKKDRHEHIGEGKIGEKGLGKFLENLSQEIRLTSPTPRQARNTLSAPRKGKIVADDAFALILETEHDKVRKDIEILKKLSQKYPLGKK